MTPLAASSRRTYLTCKAIPTTGLLAQVLVAKFADHLPLYRQEAIFGRAGFEIPRSTLAQWVGSCGVQLQPLVDALKEEILTHAVLHADETPVQMLKPGNGKTHRDYLWAYAPGVFEATRAVVSDFCETRVGEHGRLLTLSMGLDPVEQRQLAPPSVLAAAAMLCPPWTSLTASCLNSSVYLALAVFVIYFLLI